MRQLIPYSANTIMNDSVLSNYEKIRESFHYRANTNIAAGGGGSGAPRILPSNGKFFQNSTDYNILHERYAGFDKLFTTLIQGCVDDPDFALRKDPQIYQRMLRDPQIYYCLMVRKTATSSLPWQVVPPDEFTADSTAVQLAEQANARIKSIPQFRELLNSVLDALLPGMSVNELIWSVNDAGQYIITNHFPQNKDRFKFTREGQLQLLQPKAPTVGLPVPSYKFVTHRFQIRDGSWVRPDEAGYVYYGQGLADTPLYHYFYFKVTALRYMLKNLERNSSPFKVYYTGPQNATLAAKMDQILAALQNDSVVGIPGKKGETNVDVAQPRGGADVYIGLIEYVDRLITRAILGQELMTEMPAVGSYAAAQVHASVFAKITENDSNLLQDTLNSTLMRFDAELNTPQVPPHMRPIFKFKSSALVDTGAFLATVQQAMSIGLTVSENQVRELSGLREPAPHEKPLQMVMQPDAAGKAGAGAGSDKKTNKAKEQGRAEGTAVANRSAKKKAGK